MSSLFVFAASREVEPFVSTLPRTLQTGIGKAAAAVAVARELATRDTRLVCLLGVAGAYGADPEVGSVCVVEAATFADEGAASTGGFVNLVELGLASPSAATHDRRLTERIRDALSVPIVTCATVSTCSGTDGLAAEYAARTGASIETMESAAVALACAVAGVPLVELRAISNRCGDRARGGWDVDRAVLALGEHVRMLLASGCLDD